MNKKWLRLINLCFVLPQLGLAANPAADLSGLGSKKTEGVTQNPSNYVPRYEGAPKESGTWHGGGLGLPTGIGNAKINDCSTLPLDTDLYKRQECEAINFEAKNRSQRPPFSITPEDSLSKVGKEEMKNPRDRLERHGWMLPPLNADGSIGSQPVESCEPSVHEIPPTYKEEICTSFLGNEKYLCTVANKVTVVPHWKYQCLIINRKESNQTCVRKKINSCESGPQGAGISPNSPNGDMAIKQTYENNGIYSLQFGVIGDNYWTTSYTPYDRSMMFDISDVATLDLFVLQDLIFDDYVLVKINGYQIYAGPKGGSKLEIVVNNQSSFGEKGVDIGLGPIFPLDLKASSVHNGANINLLPYLVVGQNRIDVRTVVGGGGEVALTFKTRMACREVWESSCAGLEARQ